jgi:chromosome partitioning protein
MQVISFVNMKGGVGKTTLAVNIACGLALRHRKKVLMIDADPQFNATQYLLEDDRYLNHIDDNTKGTIRDIFIPKRLGSIRTTSGISSAINKSKISLEACSCRIFGGRVGTGLLDLVPSTLALIEIEFLQRGSEIKFKKFH